MNKKQKAPFFQLHIGSSSIVLIFVILCLVSFAVLSLVSANADRKLSSQVADRTQAYYAAQNQIQHTLASFHEELTTAYEQSENESVYFTAVGYVKTFTAATSDLQDLSVSVNILYPTSPDSAFYEITSWQIITTEDVEYENALNVIP